MKKFAMAVVCGACAASAFGDETYYVATDGDDDNNTGLSAQSPFKTPKKAMDMIAENYANRPFTVVLAKGEYFLDAPIQPSSADANKTLGYDNMTIRGATDNRADVVLNGQGKTSAVYFPSHPTDASGNTGHYGIQIRNLTVTNGWKSSSTTGASVAGAGIYFAWGATLSNCLVTCCHLRTENGTCSGAGVYMDSGGAVFTDTLVENCTITNHWTSGSSELTTGAGIRIRGGTLRNCLVRNCHIYNDYIGNTGWFGRSAGAGVYNVALAFSMYDTEVTGCTVTNAYAATASVSYSVSGDGGGLYVSTSGGTMKNCHIHHNAASCAGSALTLTSSSAGFEILNCTIASNETRSVQTSNYGFGALCLKGPATVDGCRFVGNSLSKIGYNGGGGAFTVNTGTDQLVTVRNCLIEGNTASSGGGGAIGGDSGGDKTIVSNCIFRANAANASSGNGGAFACYPAYGALLVDCLFVSNTACRGSALASRRSSSKTDVAGITVRNCLVSGGSVSSIGRGAFYVDASSSSAGLIPLNLEYCTVVDNDRKRADNWEVSGSSGTAVGRHTFIKGCLFAANGTDGTRNLSSDFATSENVSYTCAAYNYANLPQGAAYHNIDCDDPKFVNAAGRDWRLSGESPLVDKGGPQGGESWMGTGERRTGPRDLGQPAWTVTRVGDYGVRVDRGRSVARIRNDYPEPGCYEYNSKSGVILTVR